MLLAFVILHLGTPNTSGEQFSIDLVSMQVEIVILLNKNPFKCIFQGFFASSSEHL